MFDISERKKAEDKILKLQEELETLSYKDSLTGVANRRMLDALLDVEWAKSRASRLPISLILVDIDFFKQYNDHYGHRAGDECLKRVAHVLDTAAGRSRDLCARLGGEEFVLVLPETDAAVALQVAERCRKLLTREGIPHAQSHVASSVTVSMGLGTVVPDPQDELSEFFELVDRRLYQAKANGRNRIEVGVD
jgi:diguanylate cyclase (GGDEF)-like protein